MPFPVPYPLINGHRYSWASIDGYFNGLPLLGIRAINFKQELKSSKVWGSKPQPIGRTRGKYDASGDVELLRREFDVLVASLAGGVGYGEIPFDIVVQFSELPGEPIVTTDLLMACRIDEEESSNTEGTDPSYIKLSLSIMRIKHNGADLAAPIGIAF